LFFVVDVHGGVDLVVLGVVLLGNCFELDAVYLSVGAEALAAVNSSAGAECRSFSVDSRWKADMDAPLTLNVLPAALPI
jgi:hypothetical protein